MYFILFGLNVFLESPFILQHNTKKSIYTSGYLQHCSNTIFKESVFAQVRKAQQKTGYACRNLDRCDGFWLHKLCFATFFQVDIIKYAEIKILQVCIKVDLNIFYKFGQGRINPIKVTRCRTSLSSLGWPRKPLLVRQPVPVYKIKFEE